MITQIHRMLVPMGVCHGTTCAKQDDCKLVAPAARRVLAERTFAPKLIAKVVDDGFVEISCRAFKPGREKGTT